MEAMFERPGPRGGTPIVGSCWCQYARGMARTRPERKAAMRTTVHAGRVPGLLAYVDGVPRGWVSVAPGLDFPGLQRSARPDEDLGPVYAITCLFVDPPLRSTGLASTMLDAAIEHARGQGAAAVLAFPKAELAPHAQEGGRAEEAFSFMGRRASFESRGFTQVRTAGKRLVMRLEL
jgi:GNAT superfamily N-acetyltransferase